MKKTLIALFMSLFAITAATAQTDSTALTKVGDMAPAFICKTIVGETVDISKLKGKIVMINFFATWCGPCNKELPIVQKDIWDSYKDRKDFVLLIIGRNHSDAEVKDFVEKKNFTMPFAADPEREIYKLYATEFIPRNIIIGKTGKIIFQNKGFQNEEFKKLEAVLKENLE
jgi:peroxiredoxin